VLYADPRKGNRGSGAGLQGRDRFHNVVLSLGFSGIAEARPPDRTLHDFPETLRIVALASLPFFHSMSTSNPSRARSPVTLPVGHALGNAGKSSISPAWLCSSISPMAAAYSIREPFAI
jgi:hypothetical protein